VAPNAISSAAPPSQPALANFHKILHVREIGSAENTATRQPFIKQRQFGKRSSLVLLFVRRPSGRHLGLVCVSSGGTHPDHQDAAALSSPRISAFSAPLRYLLSLKFLSGNFRLPKHLQCLRMYLPIRTQQTLFIKVSFPFMT